jgi:hypothetical protein
MTVGPPIPSLLLFRGKSVGHDPLRIGHSTSRYSATTTENLAVDEIHMAFVDSISL